MSEVKHTALPWHVMPDGFARKGLWSAPTVYATDDELRYVAVCACADHINIEPTDNLANANFIVRACNAHYDLLEAAKALDNWWLESFPGGPDGDRAWFGVIGELSEDTINIWRAIRAAIAKAEGRALNGGGNV